MLLATVLMGAPPDSATPSSGSILPAAGTSSANSAADVTWEPLLKQTFLFLGLEHGFRFATEPGTRHGVRRMSLRGYKESLGNLHGWSDGDPFYVNYIGHPMQGAATGYLWAQNDLKYRNTEFGRDSRYWKGRLRAAGYMFVYSEQFEIGPLSEASIGHIQRDYPQQGFVDHVVTPAIGLGWMVTEDAIDRYLVKRLEASITNRWARLFIRGTLNPTRSFANVTRRKYPWHRDTREGVETYRAETATYRPPATQKLPAVNGVAPFAFSAGPETLKFSGAGYCTGGGADVALRLSATMQAVAVVSGCKLLDTNRNHSGDSLTYLLGPRWTPSPNRRFEPYLEMLVGGHKMTAEEIFPDRKRQLEALSNYRKMDAAYLYSQYARHTEANGPAIGIGGGLNINVSRALAFRVANFQYLHSWIPTLEGVNRTNSYRLTAGFTLRMGTW